MNRNAVRIFIGFALIIAIGGLLGWWMTRSNPLQPASELPPTEPVVVEPASTNAVAKTNVPTETPASEDATEKPSSILDTPVTVANWEEHLEEILTNDKIDTDQKADKLADMIPKLPEPAQVDLAGHLANLVADEFYPKTATILKSETTPSAVSEILLNDLFNRDQALMLPINLAIAKNDKHPLKAEALQNLEMVLQEDFGTNWVEWEQAVNKAIGKETAP